MKTITLKRIKYENLKKDRIEKVKVPLISTYPLDWDPNCTIAFANATKAWRLGKS